MVVNRKQFLVALFSAPLAVFGLKKKPAPAGLQLVRVYDARIGRFVNYFEEFYAREGFKPSASALREVDLPYPKVGDTIHVRTPPRWGRGF